MNKLDFRTPDLPVTVDLGSATDLLPARRLIVLIPAEADCSPVTRRVWELANATGSAVQFLGLCKDADQEPALRRDLVTMSALIRGAQIPAEAVVEFGKNWVEAVKRNYRPGDMVVCVADPRVGFQGKPLSHILESSLKAPVYILSRGNAERPKPSWLFQLVTWVGFVGIVIGFFILQMKVTQLTRDWPQSVLLILLLIPEFWLIWVWNSLFN